MEQTQESLPEWLNSDFLDKALQSFKQDKTIKVLSFTVNSKFSEHFSSSMIQSSIKFSSSKSEIEEISVVIKLMPSAEKNNVIDAKPYFETEIKMYKEVIPAMTKLFERNGMKIELGPELIYAASEPFEFIILKDMSPEGFSSPQTALDDIEDSKLFIKRLAEFQAASYYLAENNEYDFSNFKQSIYSQHELIKGIFEDSLKVFKDVLATWEGYEHFIPKVDNLLKNYGEIGLRSYAANVPGQGFNVLNHGDFHTRNLLVKLNEKKRVERFIFIDYQLSVYSSPLVDMSYMFGLIKRDENGEIPRDEIIKFYHQEFVKALKNFGFKKQPPTLIDLNREISKHGTLIVLFEIIATPLLMADWNSMKMEDMMGKGDDSEFKKKLFNLPACKQILQKEMKYWANKGWF